MIEVLAFFAVFILGWMAEMATFRVLVSRPLGTRGPTSREQPTCPRCREPLLDEVHECPAKGAGWYVPSPEGRPSAYDVPAERTKALVDQVTTPERRARMEYKELEVQELRAVLRQAGRELSVAYRRGQEMGEEFVSNDEMQDWYDLLAKIAILSKGQP